MFKKYAPYGFLIGCALFVIVQFYITIWHFTDANRYGSFPEEDKIRVAHVLGGNYWTRLYFMNHFRSVVMNTESNIEMHIIADEENARDVNALLTTWNLTNLEWKFYDLKEYTKRVDWIPNTHYSKYYGLTKLLIPEVLKNVAKVIYLDVDIIFRDDLFYLWKKFRYFNNFQAIGMVENLSDWYLNKDGRKSVWPALKRGYNAGLIMMDLHKLRDRYNWNTEWRRIAEEQLRIRGKVSMSDQDIFNTFIYEHPESIYDLPCVYNYQLGDKSLSEEMCKQYPLAVHFNSQNKSKAKNYYMYNLIRKELDGIDANDLRIKRSKKVDRPFIEQSFCGRYLPETNHRILPNAIGGSMKDNRGICMITQFTIDRIKSFISSAQLWPYPISAAFYGTNEDMSELVFSMKAINKTNIAVHMVFEEPRESGTPKRAYPINFLRNTAIKYANCEFLFMVDADFMVLGDLESLQNAAKNIGPKEVLVVPALEMTNDTIDEDPATFPKTKNEVVQLVKDGKMQVFRDEVWPSAHKATNLSEWMVSNKTYKVHWKKNYEPYFVIRKDACPEYDQRFGGYGWNKVTHVMELRLLQFDFMVSSDVFMIHKNHNPSTELSRWRNDVTYQKCLSSLKNMFVKETAEKLGVDLRN